MRGSKAVAAMRISLDPHPLRPKVCDTELRREFCAPMSLSGAKQ
jgi:hypothetical protein